MAQLGQTFPKENWKPRFSSMSQKSKIVFDCFPTNTPEGFDVGRPPEPLLGDAPSLLEQGCPGALVRDASLFAERVQGFDDARAAGAKEPLERVRREEGEEGRDFLTFPLAIQRRGGKRGKIGEKGADAKATQVSEAVG